MGTCMEPALFWRVCVGAEGAASEEEEEDEEATLPLEFEDTSAFCVELSMRRALCEVFVSKVCGGQGKKK